jgi:N6-adenosine-specific RNA methylase IME4
MIQLPFPNGVFRSIYADPPWPEYGGGRIRRGANRHYTLMSIEEIKALYLEVKRIAAEDCHLYLWTTNNYLPQALEVMAKWGFQYRTTITWAKDRFGLGQYFRGQTEHCLFGVRGMLPYRERSDGKRAQGTTLIQAPRQEHSQKPEEMANMIEVVSYPPYLEMFARHLRPGWSTWGEEAGSQTITLPMRGLG